jgi:peroxiredoxin Q/BCP
MRPLKSFEFVALTAGGRYLMALPKIGDLAPAFSLPNQDGEIVALRQFRDKKNIVLYFYPKAMTPGCTTQACGLRDSLREYDGLDTVVLGVSPDPVSRLQKFREKYSLTFDLLSDEDRSLANRYGVWGLKKFMGREFMGLIRTTFIIGKDGRLAHIIDKVKTKTHHDDVLASMEQLRLGR